MLDVYKNSMLAGGIKQFQVMFQKLYRGFSDQYMDSPLNCIEGNWEMRGIWREDGDSAAARKCINCSFVCLGITLTFLRIGLEGDVEAVVHLEDVLVQVIACIWSADCII